MKKRGFTLIELLVVIAIIGILASIVLVSVGGSRKNANATKAKADLHGIMTAAELCNSAGTTGNVPTSGSITCGGDVVLQSIPTPPSGYGSAYSISGTYASYSLTIDSGATGFTDSGVFTCVGGSCSCNPSTGCIK